MRAGPLHRRIVIQRSTLVHDGYQQVQQWRDFYATWASVDQQAGREFFAQQTVQANRRVVFRLRYRRGINVRDRVMYAGVVHDIQDVRELGRGIGVELHTVADANEAAS